MEEGLADIFDEDDPPSVAVAASATQSFGARCVVALLFAPPHSPHLTAYTRSKCRTAIHMVTGQVIGYSTTLNYEFIVTLVEDS